MKISEVVNIDIKEQKADIHINGIIGFPSSLQHEDPENIITTKQELNALLKISKDVKKITLHIGSPGGSVNHALAMFHALNIHKAEKFVKYTDASASAATVLAAVAPLKNISLPSFLTVLIHEARMGSGGTVSDLKRDISEIEKSNQNIAQIYSNLNGKSIEQNLAIMSEDHGEGRLMTADEAKKEGFVGEVIELNQNIAALDYSKLVGWSEKQINKLKSINNKQMGLFDKKKPLKYVEADGKQITFREIAQGKEVEIIGAEESFSGTFNYENKAITVQENKITAIAEKSSENEEISELKTLILDFAEKVTNLEKELKAKFTEIDASLDSNTKAFAEAKIKVSNPDLPTQEFKQESAIADDRTISEKINDMQAKMQEEREEKRDKI